MKHLSTGVAGGNGVYGYGAGGFPTDTFNAANYWVDVVFLTSAPPPPPPPPPGPVTLTDTTDADFTAGTPDANIRMLRRVDGELSLGPLATTAFDGTALPAGWSSVIWTTGGSTVVSGGRILVDGARASSDALVQPGTSLEFLATFSSDAFEHVGFGITLNETPWAMFGTAGGGSLFARTHTGSLQTDTPLPGSWLNAPHRYRVDWGLAAVTFFIDGVQVASHPVVISGGMRPLLSNFEAGGSTLAVDSLALMPSFAASATFTSRVLDGGASVNWNSATWAANTPAGTSLSISARFGNTALPDASWTAFAAIPSSGASLGQQTRYVQDPRFSRRPMDWARQN